MDAQTEISWIFMAIGYASQKQPADFAAISQVADGINHAMPTHKELQNSIARLLELTLIKKEGKKYTLSKSGDALLTEAQEKGKTLSGVWKGLEIEFATIIKT